MLLRLLLIAILAVGVPFFLVCVRGLLGDLEPQPQAQIDGHDRIAGGTTNTTPAAASVSRTHLFLLCRPALLLRVGHVVD